jgi:hypothetical protein
MNASNVRGIVAGLVLATLAGCGSGTLPVGGKVTIKGGASAEGSSVAFSDSEKQIGATGRVKADGTYTLDKSLPLGKYAVTIHPPSAKDSSQMQPPSPFHAKYQNPTTSGLEREVKSSDEKIDFELDPPARAAGR